MQEVRENVGSVVWQDKGNESPRFVAWVFSRSILPFTARYRDSYDVGVTRAARLVMTRARGYFDRRRQIL